jgi:hypothetical protein
MLNVKSSVILIVICLLLMVDYSFAVDTAYVDMQKILSSSTAGNTAKIMLTKLINDLDTRENYKINDGGLLVSMFEAVSLGVKPKTIYEVDQAFFDQFRNA